MNSFNLPLLLENHETAIKNKPKDLLSELRGFKFVTTWLQCLKKKKKRLTMQQIIKLFIGTQKQEKSVTKIMGKAAIWKILCFPLPPSLNNVEQE